MQTEAPEPSGSVFRSVNRRGRSRGLMRGGAVGTAVFGECILM